MEEKRKYSKAKPGLEEALHPAIGNGASWEDNPHAYLLRNIDPSKALESRLIAESEKQKIIQLWNKPANSGEEVTNRPGDEEHILPSVQEQEAIQQNDLVEPTKEESLNIPHLSRSASMEDDASSEAVKESKAKPKKQAVKASKRIRKVADKAKKDEETYIKEQELNAPNLTTSNLSPFTQWVKGLLGSDYVHPYGDDFAIEQGENALGEGISETFADLLASQGYKDQAIGMYQKLIEKFPEKSRFFAAKIEALQ